MAHNQLVCKLTCQVRFYNFDYYILAFLFNMDKCPYRTHDLHACMMHNLHIAVIPHCHSSMIVLPLADLPHCRPVSSKWVSQWAWDKVGSIWIMSGQVRGM